MAQHSACLRRPSPSPPPRRRAEAGFTVLELVVALFVLALVLVFTLAIFDASNRVAKAQINISNMQQSLRIGHNEVVKMTRMAARGWVLRGNWSQANLVRMRDNVGGSAYIDGSSDPALKILPGTDVLRIRGVISGSMFEPTNPAGVFLEPKLELDPTSPSGFKQELQQFRRAEEAGNDFKLLLISAQGEVATADADVSALVPPSPSTAPPTKATVTFDPATAAEGWVSLPGHPIAVVGIVEEYAFYIRENNGEPRLSLARFKAGTNLPYGGLAANLRQDVADDVLDLQVAMGIDLYTDTNGDATVDSLDKGDGVVTAAEWFYNTVGGPLPTQTVYSDGVTGPAFGEVGDLALLRISTLARTQGRDFQYVAKAIDRIENHNYAEPATPGAAEVAIRQHRRRLLQTVVSLRNR